MEKEISEKIIKHGKLKEFHALQAYISHTSTKSLIDEVRREIISPDGYDLVNYMFIGLADDTEKMFQIIVDILNQMNAIEVQQNRCYDIIIRFYEELPKLNANQLVILAEFCMESIRQGDTKCVGWKDLLPEVIRLLTTTPFVMLNGLQMTVCEYREQFIKNLCTMKWPTTVLTPFAMMLKELAITSDEKTSLFKKILDNLNDLRPEELPPLAYQLFRFCDSADMFVMSIFCFDMYFQKHDYKNSLVDIENQYSRKEILEAQETILYHLDKATDHFITEKSIVNSCRPLSAAPRFILSPFILSALLAMCNNNRYPDSTRLSSSAILQDILNVIQNNELEKEMSLHSAWCRDIAEHNTVSVENITEVLIEQSKDGTEIVTPGIAALAFVLLKSSNPSLNAIASYLLEKFVTKRFIFGPGIIKHVTDFMLADQKSQQYDDCLTRLSRTNPLTFIECLDTIERILEYLLLIPGHNAMRMMTCIIPLIKSSLKIRDMFVAMLRKAMYKREVETRQLGVYGLCVVLKNLRESNAAVRANIAPGTNSQSQTQYAWSGCSLMSQSMMLGSAADTPARNFDIFALEILGILRKCFTEYVDIKEILYDGLTKAIDCNPKLTPHILQFLEWHFESFFTVDSLNCEIHLKNVLHDSDKNCDSFVIYDHLGKLMQLMGQCVYACQKYELVCDTTTVESVLDTLIKRITRNQYGLVDRLDKRTSVLGCQYLNCLEALMSYAIWTTNLVNNRIQLILKLQKHHTETAELLRAANVAKKSKKAKKNNVTQASNVTQSKKTPTIVHQPENIWDLVTLERFFHVMHDDMVPFANSDQTAPMRSNNEFNRLLLRTAISRIQSLLTLPEYLQIRHSQSTFQHLIRVSRIIYEKCVKQLAALSSRFDLISVELSAQCFHACLTVTTTLYKQKFKVFLQGITNQLAGSIGANSANVIEVLQLLLEQCLKGEISDAEGKVSNILLLCLEIIYEYVPMEGTNLVNHYDWLHQFCLEKDLDAHNMSLIHKILFCQSIRAHPDGFFDAIAIQIGDILGQIEKKPMEGRFKLSSLTIKTVDSCILIMCACLKQQIEEAEYFITKSKSFYARIKIAFLSESENCISSMKNIERKVANQLITIAMTAIPLCNARLPSGECIEIVVRLLIQYYICFTNLTKHLILRHASVPVLYHEIDFDELVRRIGKSLPNKVYGLIEYIERTLPPEKSLGKKAATQKSLRDLKLLPNLVYQLENLYKTMQELWKKTKNDLSKHLPIGTARDFQINSKGLKEAMNRILESQCSEVDETLLEEVVEVAALDGAVISQMDSLPEKEVNVQTSLSTSLPVELVMNSLSGTRVALKNLSQIKAKVSKKRTQPTIEKFFGCRTLQDGQEVVPKKQSRKMKEINKENISGGAGRPNGK